LKPSKIHKSEEERYEDKKDDAESISEKAEHHVIPLGVTGKDDLDPVALHKAWKFAAWSSLILVRSLLFWIQPQ